MEEEEEALRLQREQMEGLRAEDYGGDDEEEDVGDEEEEEEEGEETMKDKAMKVRSLFAAATSAVRRVTHLRSRSQIGCPSNRKVNPHALSLTRALMLQAAKAKGYEVERVTRDPTTLTDLEKLSIATANAPELIALLKELQEHLAELRHRLGPVLEEVRWTSERLLYRLLSLSSFPRGI